MFAIEGTIGVGKSTVLQALRERGYAVRQEAVDHWTLLPAFYKDPQTYSFPFQLQVLASYADCTTGIVERSAESAFHIFSTLLYSKHFLCEESFTILHTIQRTLPVPDHIFYLHAPAHICHDRVVQRNRQGETVSVEYIQELQDQYELYLSSVSNVTYIDATQSPEVIADKIILVLQRLHK